MWFLTDFARLERERAAVEALAAEVSWLDGVYWHIDGSDVVLDCTICLDSEACYEVRTRFPSHYPSAPPSVRPREPARWSSHQYGSSGDLCLELGPDNWHRDQHTVADMLTSAHRLLTDEEARQTDETVVIPSRHAETQGQRQRGKFVRFIMTPSAKSALETVDDGAWAVAHFTVMYHEKAWTVFLTKLERDGDDPWVCNELPGGLTLYGRGVLGLVNGGTQGALLPAMLLDAEALTTYLDGQTLPIPDGESDPLSADRVEFVLMRTENEPWQLTMRWDRRRKVWSCSTLLADTSPAVARLGPESAALADNTVAIVGLGSVGSKIATSLARAGVGRFALIDDDLLHPANLVRHDSDWSHVGQHKVDAVADRLAFVNPNVHVKRHRVRLVGQESATTAASAISSLGRASVIVDATANSDVFNLCAHIARQTRRPLVWLEVYAGGLGLPFTQKIVRDF